MGDVESKRSAGDLAHAAFKAGLSAIPAIGGPAVELFQFLVQPPLERRRVEWMQEVGERLMAIEAKGVDVEALQRDERFVSVMMQASIAAMRTHQREKIRALQNAVLNIAGGQGPDETLQHLLLTFIDGMTELHLRILTFARSPNPPGNIGSAGLGHVLEQKIPELQGQRVLYDQLWRDLHTRGLVNLESLHVMMTSDGLSQRRTTELGEALLTLISAAA